MWYRITWSVLIAFGSLIASAHAAEGPVDGNAEDSRTHAQAAVPRADQRIPIGWGINGKPLEISKFQFDDRVVESMVHLMQTHFHFGPNMPVEASNFSGTITLAAEKHYEVDVFDEKWTKESRSIYAFEADVSFSLHLVDDDSGRRLDGPFAVENCRFTFSVRVPYSMGELVSKVVCEKNELDGYNPFGK